MKRLLLILALAGCEPAPDSVMGRRLAEQRAEKVLIETRFDKLEALIKDLKPVPDVNVYTYGLSIGVPKDSQKPTNVSNNLVVVRAVTDEQIDAIRKAVMDIVNKEAAR